MELEAPKGIDDALAMGANIRTVKFERPERPRPLPLMRPLDDAPPFPVSALGPELAPIAARLNEAIQAPPAICAQSVLAAANMAVQGHADVSVDGRTYPLSLYLACLGESGERKTAVDREALRSFRAFEKKLAAQYRQELAEHKTCRAIYEKQRESALRVTPKTVDPDALRNGLDALGDEPQPPLDPAMMTEEPTFEGLVKLFHRGRPSLGLVTSEGGRLIGGYGMSAEHQLKTGAGLSELWDGSQLTRVRAKDGESLTTQGKRLSLSIMAQPGVGLSFVNNQVLVDQGLNSRILVTWPKSMAGSRRYRAIDLRKDPLLGSFHARISQILERPFPLAEGQRNELEPREIYLDDDAKSHWVQVYEDIERHLGPDGRFAPIRGLANKGAEHVLRIAGTLALFSDPACSSVHLQYIEAAAELVEFYLVEALRIRGAAASNPDLELAVKAMAWARREGGRFGMSRLYTHGPYGIRDKDTAHKIVSILEEHNQIFPLPENTTIAGRRFKEAWEVNNEAP